jgi:hypothetical protein
MSHKVSFRNFDPARVIFDKIDAKNTKDSNGTDIKYFIINLKYKYEINGRDIIDRLYIEGPKIKSRGPQNKTYEDKGRSVWSLYTRFDTSDPDQLDFINTDSSSPGTMHRLARKCCEFVFNNKKDLGNPKGSNPDVMVTDVMHYPIRFQDNDMTGMTNPSAIFKLMRYGKDPANMKEASFILPINGGKKIEWSMISDSSIIHMPLLKIDNITVAGGHPTIKMELVSSVIHEIVSGGSENLQKDTVEKANVSPEVAAALEARLKEMEAKLATMTAAASKGSPLESAPSSAPPFIPTGPEQIPGLPPIVRQESSVPTPVVASLPTSAPSLDDVLSSAPSLPSLPSLSTMELPSGLPNLPGLP